MLNPRYEFVADATVESSIEQLKKFGITVVPNYLRPAMLAHLFISKWVTMYSSWPVPRPLFAFVAPGYAGALDADKCIWNRTPLGLSW